jgi:ornithine carbamoyltransferase
MVAENIARETGAQPVAEDDPQEGAVGADVVYRDLWLSLREPKEAWTERIQLLRPHHADEALMAATRFLHCLTAFHDDQTEVGAAVLATLPGEPSLDVSEAVFQSPASTVVDQAENRKNTLKAAMVATAGAPRTGHEALRPSLLPD